MGCRLPLPGIAMPDSPLPSAVPAIDRILERLGPHPAVFLDYDGTLTDIVGEPSQARIGEEERAVLRQLSGLVPVGVISGRALDDVRAIVAVDGLSYSGSHGFEIETIDGRRMSRPEAADAVPQLQAAGEFLTDEVADLGGVVVEVKPYAIAVHTRLAESDSMREAAADLVRETAARFDQLSLRGGKEIHELRPAMDWDKGAALTQLVGFLPAGHVPLYVGDDETDEDGFLAAERLSGVGIIVGSPPLDTAASYQLKEPDEVLRFLQALTARL